MITIEVKSKEFSDNSKVYDVKLIDSYSLGMIQLACSGEKEAILLAETLRNSIAIHSMEITILNK